MQKVKKQRAWIDAKKKYRLSDATVQMAMELGLNPSKLGKIVGHKQEPWKEPLANFIRTLYEKKFKLRHEAT